MGVVVSESVVLFAFKVVVIEYYQIKLEAEIYCCRGANDAGGSVDIEKVLSFYFQTCSLEMTCESMAIMAASLANGGICPITGDRVLSNTSVKNILSLMYSCGMYNYSGQFAFQVSQISTFYHVGTGTI